MIRFRFRTLVHRCNRINCRKRFKLGLSEGFFKAEFTPQNVLKTTQLKKVSISCVYCCFYLVTSSPCQTLTSFSPSLRRLDPGCECKVIISNDQAGGAAHWEKRVCMRIRNASKLFQKDDPWSISDPSFLVFFSPARGGSVVFVSSVAGYQPMPVRGLWHCRCSPVSSFTDEPYSYHQYSAFNKTKSNTWSLGRPFQYHLYYTVLIWLIFNIQTYKHTVSGFPQALGPYSVSKTALLGLTRALAPELAQSNIRVNCVAPGVIKTQFSSMVSMIHMAVLYVCVCVCVCVQVGLSGKWVGLGSFLPLKPLRFYWYWTYFIVQFCVSLEIYSSPAMEERGHRWRVYEADMYQKVNF